MHLLLLPTQLFDFRKVGVVPSKVTLYEDPHFFTAFRYHKLKLLYHRLTCKVQAELLRKQGYAVRYVEFHEKLPKEKWHMFDPVHHELLDKYKKGGATILPTPQFLDASPLDPGNGGHAPFYRRMRKRLGVLIDKTGPVGRKWSFDEANRLPPTYKAGPPAPPRPRHSTVPHFAQLYALSAQYIHTHFDSNYGDIPDRAAQFPYPVDHAGARHWLRDFVAHRLSSFGPYEDAIDKNSDFVYHSVLSPMMNIGLLLDREVLEAALRCQDVKLNSLEGFVRQVIGWRQYVHALYVHRGKVLKRSNFLGHRRRLTDAWWTASTGMPPVDAVIRKIQRLAYAHHIERLMVLGNWMLLNQTDPREVYRIFMEWTIDAYEWVMVPNVFGMSQFADGGQMMRRPYFSAAAYLLKMSNYGRGSGDDDWVELWNACYYAFIDKHKKKLAKNYFMQPALHVWKNKPQGERRRLLRLAKEYAARQ